MNVPIPSHMEEALLRYVEHRIEPGSFLSAVICNDLRAACERADDLNRRLLFEYVSWLYNKAPAGSWGSYEAMQAWLNPEDK